MRIASARRRRRRRPVVVKNGAQTFLFFFFFFNPTSSRVRCAGCDDVTTTASLSYLRRFSLTCGLRCPRFFAPPRPSTARRFRERRETDGVVLVRARETSRPSRRVFHSLHDCHEPIEPDAMSALFFLFGDPLLASRLICIRFVRILARSFMGGEQGYRITRSRPVASIPSSRLHDI